MSVAAADGQQRQGPHVLVNGGLEKRRGRHEGRERPGGISGMVRGLFSARCKCAERGKADSRKPASHKALRISLS